MAVKASSIFKSILRGFLGLLVFILAVELLLYFLAPVYDFPKPSPFSGQKIFNPYKDMDSTNWIKGNFHFHTRAWSGLTSGRQNSNEAFWKTYRSLGYDVPCISNYQSISTFNKDSSFYIPVYEHGFGIRKKHQLCIGAKQVLWMDYSFIQNLNQKQAMIDRLRETTKVLALAHPDWENGYTLGDMQWLSNYDLLEVLDANWRSIPQWDAALSSGHPVFILADDDAHDINDPYEIGRCCTFINTPVNRSEDIMSALKSGNAFGAEINMHDKETFADKAVNARKVPRLNQVRLDADTLRIAVSRKALKIEFIGQDGAVKKTMTDTSVAWYKILPEDTYIRPFIIFPDENNNPGTKFYLNPVYRYDGDVPTNALRAEINYPRTWILRIMSIPALFIILIFLAFRRYKKNNLN